METRTILVVGGLARRYILEAEELPGPGQTIETTKPSESHTGGRGAFTAVAAHRMSHLKPPNGSRLGTESAFQDLKINVHLVATVGADDIGNSLKERMTECGVNADQVQDVQGSSSKPAVSPANAGRQRWIRRPSRQLVGVTSLMLLVEEHDRCLSSESLGARLRSLPPTRPHRPDQLPRSS